MDFTQQYLNFWSQLFGASAEDMTKVGLSFTSKGYYVERHLNKYIFYFEGLSSQKKLLACSEQNLSDLLKSLLASDLESLNADTIRAAKFFKELPLSFNDIDYGFQSASDFRPQAPSKFLILPLNSEVPTLNDFFKECTEDEKDTLDLTFENETALGLIVDGKIAAVARSAAVRNTGIADITVLVRQSKRGRGLSTILVSELVSQILKQGLCPKYRVEETNFASIAVAKRLGFKPLARLLTWEVI